MHYQKELISASYDKEVNRSKSSSEGSLARCCSFLSLLGSNTPGIYIIKLASAVIYAFCNKLEYLSINPRLGWKGLPGTNTLAYYGNRKLRP
jgi:hypothetical protein